MKKFLTVLALSFVLVSLNAQVPAPINEFVNDINAELAGESADGLTFGRSYIDSRNIIIPMYLDDSELVSAGMTLSDLIELSGGVKAFEAMLLLSIFEDQDQDDPEILMLKQYRYNIILRMIGTVSKDQVDLRILYQNL